MGDPSVLSSKLTGGPQGFGDPNDLSLRKVEMEVLIPKKMREIAKAEKCVPEVEAFTKCCSNSGVLMAFSCRNQNEVLKNCLLKWYRNEEFKERCKNEYLAERSEFRKTGVTKKKIASIRELKQELSLKDSRYIG